MGQLALIIWWKGTETIALKDMSAISPLHCAWKFPLQADIGHSNVHCVESGERKQFAVIVEAEFTQFNVSAKKH